MKLLNDPVKGKFLEIKHFPVSYQTLIFRLWENVPAKTLAKVINTTEENVLKAAEELGLGEQKNLDQWLTRGYISILKQVWQLLPYEQIFTLLDWDEERLFFCLKEDDFLMGKLGPKCDCNPVYYRELTPEEKIATEKIKNTMVNSVRIYDNEDVAVPFDFFTSHYKPLIEKTIKEVVVDSSWGIKYNCSGIDDFVEDFKTFAKNYGVDFSGTSNKAIEIEINIPSNDEEYHEITISEDCVKINTASPVGVLRALYYIEDLAESAGSFTFDKKSYKRKTKMKTRFIYSFCGLYADVLDKDTRISFPDELLKGYARRGINGVWIQGVLYKLAPYPFDEKECEGWEKRLSALDELTKRAARYGIKVYMYINEPRPLPLSFFEDKPQLKGSALKEGFACLCSSRPETHEYLKTAIQTVCKHVPLLGGFLNITQTENRVTCLADGLRPDKSKLCPVCSEIPASEVVSGIIKTMADAVYEVNPDIKYFFYAWSLSHTIGEEEQDKLVAKLPKNVIVLQVSETEIPFEIGGVKDEILDYSLSIVGPGECAKHLWRESKKNGLEIAAKVQINNSWENSSAPFIPVYDNIIKHMQNLDKEGVEHIMLTWTLGGYISDSIKIASSYFFEDELNENDAYDTILKETYGKYADIVKESVHHFCDAFSNYPFNWKHIYDGPSNAGAANLFYPEPTNMKSTMTCFPYDDIYSWRGNFASTPGDSNNPVYPEAVLEQQYRLICEEWEKGLEIIEDMPSCEFKDMAIYNYTLFKASFNQISYYIERNSTKNIEKMRNIVANEKEIATMAYRIMLRNSATGYEAANHYYVTRSMLMEKIVQCDYLLNEYYK